MLGRLCLLAAFGLAGYYSWVLWGTGLSTSHAQAQLRQVLGGEIGSATNGGAGLAVRPPGDVHLADGTPLAFLKIPAIHLDIVVVEGTSVDDLEKGPGHYRDTAYPWERHGRVAIAGHRTTYLHPFWSLDKLRSGNAIQLVTRYGAFTYHVTKTAVVSPTNTSVLDQTQAPTLVLTTCNPRFSASQRLVVFASR